MLSGRLNLDGELTDVLATGLEGRLDSERRRLRRGAELKTWWGDAPAEPTIPRAEAVRSRATVRQNTRGGSQIHGIPSAGESVA